MSENKYQKDAEFYNWEGSITVVIGLPLTVYCLWAYGIRRVANLREKGFHFPLFIMMLACGFFYSVSGILIIVMAGYIKEWTTLDASEIHTYYSV